MQNYILKQQFEGESVYPTQWDSQGYERFQSPSHQLEIMEQEMDSLSFDDLYNNLRVFENDVKSPTASSSNMQKHSIMFQKTTIFPQLDHEDLTKLMNMTLRNELEMESGNDHHENKEVPKETGRKATV
ncbi:hypothetical protein Tco_0685755 [Tanacetum coccineum]